MEGYSLFKFYWDCGRMGDLEGLFFAKQSDVDKLIGKEIYFGEVLGKHSEVYGNIEKEDITKINVTSDVVAELKKNFKHDTISGYNPLDYYEGEE